MKKLIDIPMRDLEDLLDWHASQAERFEKLEKHHAEKYAAYPKHGGSLIRGDHMRATFHRRAVKIVASALDDRARAECQTKCSAPSGQSCRAAA
jgi:plasmid stabilization system protein ParE